MERDEKIALYRKCDPYKNFAIGSHEDINIDTYNANHSDVRGRYWAKELFNIVEAGEGSTYQLFTGYSGSGKTTELKRVQQMAEESGYFVVYINSDEFMDPNIEADISDIYNVIIYKTIVETNKFLGISDGFKDEGYFFRFNQLLQTEIDLKKVKTKNFVFEVKDTSTFRERVRNYVKDNFASFKREVKEELTKLNDKVKANNKKGLFVILDSMEKNKGISSNYEEVVKASEIIFSNRDNLDLPLDIIYTVPSYLSERFTGIKFLPAVKVKNKENEVFQLGIETLKALVCCRISKDKLESIFGSDYQKKLSKIIIFSGGYPRDLLKILRTLILKDDYPVEMEVIDSVFQHERNDYSELLSTKLIEQLKIVQTEKSITNIEDLVIKDKMLNNHLILRYHNNGLWFDVHPAVENLLK
jgi:hypothetical protein